MPFPSLVSARRAHAHPPTAAERFDRASRLRSRRRAERAGLAQQLRDWPMLLVLGLVGLSVVLLMSVPVLHGT